jgi:hypothetical protein
MSHFENKQTRKIDRQTIVAPQYGITREDRRNLPRKALHQEWELQLAEKARRRKVRRQERDLQLAEQARVASDTIVES